MKFLEDINVTLEHSQRKTNRCPNLISLHDFALQIKAHDAVTGDSGDKGLGVFQKPRCVLGIISKQNK